MNSTAYNVTDQWLAAEYQITAADRAMEMAKEAHWVVAFTLIPLVLSSNSLSLFAIFSIKSQLSSHFRFLVSLACSDIMVALSVSLYFANTVLHPLYPAGHGDADGGDRLVRWCSFMVIKALNTTGLLVTLLSMMGMSIDAYFAILKPSYYLSRNNKNRSLVLVISLWIFSFICGFSDFIVSSYGYFKKTLSKQYNYCEFTYISLFQEEYTIFLTVVVCLVTMCYLYCRIYAFVKSRPRPGIVTSDGRRARTSNSMNRDRQVLLTTTVILCAFVICFVPVCLLNVALIIIAQMDPSLVESLAGSELPATEKHLFNLFLLNGVIDPIIYTIRIPEVRQSYRRFLCGNRKRSQRRAMPLEVSRSNFEEETSMLKTRSSNAVPSPISSC